MSAANKNAMNLRAKFTWFCAVSPFVLWIAFATMALHIRISFGYWPDQAVDNYPAFLLNVHAGIFCVALLFAFFAAIHLIVTFIHHQQLGVRLVVIITQLLLFAAGSLAFFLIVENIPARFVTWYTD